MILTKICMPPQRRLPSLGSNVVGWVGACGLKGGSLCWCWASCPGKALVGAAEVAPARVLPGESTLPLCSSVFLALALLYLSYASVSLRLPSSALLSVAAGAALTARAQVKGSKGEPLLLYTDNLIIGKSLYSFHNTISHD